MYTPKQSEWCKLSSSVQQSLKRTDFKRVLATIGTNTLQEKIDLGNLVWIFFFILFVSGVWLITHSGQLPKQHTRNDTGTVSG